MSRVIPDLINVYRYFGRDIKQQLPLILVSFAALLASVVFRLLEPWPLKFVLDEVFAEPGAANSASIALPASWSAYMVVWAVAVAVVVIAVCRATADYSSRVGFFKVGNVVVIRVRDRLYRHLQSLPLSFHDRTRHGDLITRVTRDVNLLRDVTATAILPLLGSVLVLAGMAIVMFWLSWKLAAVSLIVVPLYWLTTVRLGRRIRSSARKQRERESAMANIASESLGSIRSIKAHCLEKKFADDFDRQNNQGQIDDLKASRLSLQLGRTVDILLAIATACVLGLGAQFVLSGALSAGEFVVFLVYLKRCFKPAQAFAKYTARIVKATVAGERVIALLSQPVEAANQSAGKSELEIAGGEIRFHRVCFGYDDQQLVLKDFDLVIEAGSTVAITGPSGVGKSTLLSLLLRFYETGSGKILVDGQDIAQCSITAVRSAFNVVLQDPLLFAGTVRDNIRLVADDNEVSDEQILAAARLAEVDAFVLSMPDQYEAQIGEKATTLSRGQQQRIAIARAALVDHPIMLLDEPTTGLDEFNQRLIADALLELAQDKTAILVTHDLGFARRADEIIYLQDGQVRQQGTHEVLMNEEGPYAEFFEMQMEQAR